MQRLSQDEGVNLAGIKRIIELESHVDALRAKVAELAAELPAGLLAAAPDAVDRPRRLAAAPPLVSAVDFLHPVGAIDRRSADRGRVADVGRPQPGVRAARLEQLVVRAVLDHPAAVEHHDPVGAGGGGQPVGDDERGAAAGSARRSPRSPRLGGQVERGGRLVEQQDVGVDQLGPGQRDQLALTGRQVAAALADLVAGNRR